MIYDHTSCRQEDHDRSTAETDPTMQRVDTDGLMLCNHCGAPLMYCRRVDDYDHADPDTPDCFLVSK